MKKTLLITTASWEPRFLLGSKRIKGRHDIHSCLYFWFEEYAERTRDSRVAFESEFKFAHLSNVSLSLKPAVCHNFDRLVPAHANTWRKIYQALETNAADCTDFVLDISTMPRELIWIITDLLSAKKLQGVIEYHRAESHGQWCGSEPSDTHIVPKLGGLPIPENPTKLLIVAGYDQDRSEQFITAYEPTETLILCQSGVHAENIEKNIKRHREKFGNRGAYVTIREIDCYSDDWGYAQLFGEASLFGQGANLLMASLGPKPSAIALYQVHRKIETTSLVYSACRDYNQDYSTGIRDTLSIHWSEQD